MACESCRNLRNRKCFIKYKLLYSRNSTVRRMVGACASKITRRRGLTTAAKDSYWTVGLASNYVVKRTTKTWFIRSRFSPDSLPVKTVTLYYRVYLLHPTFLSSSVCWDKHKRFYPSHINTVRSTSHDPFRSICYFRFLSS